MERDAIPSLEIEGKFRVASHDGIKKRLRELHIPPTDREFQRDVYYASASRDFGVTDEALRIRYGHEETVLTYKGPRLLTHGLKSREEINVSVESGKNLDRILQRLGYTPAFTVEKQREQYEWEGVEISLDAVTGLGLFVEIEVKETGIDAEECIERIKKELGIPGEHIPQSYLELLMDQRDRRST
jgi:adenylate cyclase class 2